MISIRSSDNSVLVTTLSSCDFDLKVLPFSSSLFTQDTNTLDLSGLGTSSSKLQGNVKISTNPLNLITVDDTGLLVLPSGDPNNVDDDSDELVKVSPSDLSAGYLFSKLDPGNNISLTPINSSGNEKVRISFTGELDTSVNVADSASIDLSGNGLFATPIVANAKISTTPGNKLTIDSSGLYSSGTNVTVSDTNSLDLTLSSDNISGNVKIDTTQPNLITVSSNGLRVAPLTATPITATDTTSIDFTASGQNITGAVKISPDSGNIVSVRANGVFAAAPSSTETTFVANDSSSINFTTSGTAQHTLTGVVKVSSMVGNAISILSDGIYTSPEEHKVKVTSNDTADYLENQVFAGVDPNGIVSISITVVDGKLLITPTIDVEAMCSALLAAGCVCGAPSSFTATAI